MSESHQAHIGLTDPKSPENVGAIMRAAGCYNVQSVTYTGNRFNKAQEQNKRLQTDTRNMLERIPLDHIECFKASIPKGARPVAIELVEGATSLIDYEHPENAYYIFGPEDRSIDKEVVAWCEDVIYIPTVGCMNLAATVNVVLYDRIAKLGPKASGDELIRRSRDRNNQLKV
ncbi:RNA methyltransferase [Neptuniibacter sp. PT34_22]|uniref:RNA methyltransferase n=1 Tax=unclassified Neptuniibacter TaxID=2630693 RepID=UPI0039F54379